MIVPVKVVLVKEAVVLVEWADDGILHRSVLPRTEVSEMNGQSYAQDPELGAPYGIAWAELLGTPPSPQKFEQMMYKAGLWTYDDVQKNPKRVLGVIQSFYGLDLNRLLLETKRSERSS